MIPRQGEVWWAEAADKQRPVLIVSRSDVVPMLNAIVCAPITKKVRGIPTEIPLGRAEGLKVQCAASFDNLQLIRRSLFRNQDRSPHGLASHDLRSAIRPRRLLTAYLPYRPLGKT